MQHSRQGGRDELSLRVLSRRIKHGACVLELRKVATMSQDTLTREQIEEHRPRSGAHGIATLLSDDLRILCDMALRSLASRSARGTIAHTDHPLRHWDRTCPACIAEGDSVCVPIRSGPGLYAAPTVPAQEPVAWLWTYRDGRRSLRFNKEQCDWNNGDVPDKSHPLYAAPPAPRMEVVPIQEDMARLRKLIPGCDCTNPLQCWEPCGTLGHSEEHARVVKDE